MVLAWIFPKQVWTAQYSSAQTLEAHQVWLDSHNLIPAWLPKTNQEQRSFLYLTCGDWDFKTCLADQLAFHNQNFPVFAERWINVKDVFMEVFELRTKRGLGMVRMLNMLGLRLVGRHHSGIDDCRNIARIVQRMIQAGWTPTSESYTMDLVRENPKPIIDL